MKTIFSNKRQISAMSSPISSVILINILSRPSSFGLSPAFWLAAPNKFHKVRLVCSVDRAQWVSLLCAVVGIVSLKCNTAYFNIGRTSLKSRAGHPTFFLLPDKQQCDNPTNCLVRASTTMRQILGSGSWDRGNVFSNNMT